MKTNPLNNLPSMLHNTDAWLVANADKIPLRPCSDQYLSGDKSSHTMTLASAISLIDSRKHDHAVLLHCDDHNIASIDIDSCQDSESLILSDWCQQLILNNDIRYFESSSSRTGLRICCTTRNKNTGKQTWFIDPTHYSGSPPANAEKIEIMISNNTLATYTGDVHPLCTDTDNLTTLEPLIAWLNERYPRPQEHIPRAKSYSNMVWDKKETSRDDVLDALDCVSPDIHHDEWKQIGMALKHWDVVEGEDIWINWSAGSKKFKNVNECRTAWKSFDKTKSGITVATLFHHAKNGGYRPEPQSPAQYPVVNDVPQKTEAIAVVPENLPPMPLINGIDIMNMPVVPTLVDGVLPSTGFAQIFGSSGAFKSFVALDLAMAVVSGTDWFGRSVDKGSVVYLCGEGIYGMRSRLSAWKSKGIDADMTQILMSPYMPDLSKFDMLGRLASYLKALPDLKLVVIDTFARAMIHVGNENDNAEVGQYNRIIDYLRNQVQCLILQVHHTGHANKERSRGASSLYAALDAEYQCVKLGERDGYLKCTKAKDFPEPEILNFSMKPVDDSLIVSERVRPVPTTRHAVMESVREETLTERQLNIVRTYETLYALHEDNANRNDNVTPRVLFTDLKDQLITSGVSTRDHVLRDIQRLVKKKVLIKEGVYIKMA